ncbi:MAG: GNAT family N-acetyltransferase [Rhodanobacteraceae bacterium]
MIETAAFDSIAAIDPSHWNALRFRNDASLELEDWSYLHAIERAGLLDFRFVYFALHENGKLRAAAPAFFTDYRLDTTVSGALKRVTDTVAKLLPRLLRIPMLALGSPVTEACGIGFDADSSEAQRARWLDALLTKMEDTAARGSAWMLAVKDAPVANDALWRRVFPQHGLRVLPGLPGATLDLPYADLDGYLASLSAATRKDLRRKWRAAEKLKIEWRDSLDGIREAVMSLYRATLKNAQFQFEELTEGYFESVLREMPGRAFIVTYSEGTALRAFNLVLQDRTRLLDKFFGMDYSAMDRFNLYHVSWLENVRHCIAQRIPVYESGQGLHREKQRLGSVLHANNLWYRHRNRFTDGVFARVDRFARMDEGEARCA